MGLTEPKLSDLDKTLVIIGDLTRLDLLWQAGQGRRYSTTIAGAQIAIDLEPGVMGIPDIFTLNIRDHNGGSVIGDGLTISRGQENFDLLESLYKHVRKCVGDNSRVLDQILAKLEGA